MSTLPPDNVRPESVQSLITNGLGYCCEYFFWKCFDKVPSELVTLRLGAAKRTIQLHRAAARKGKFSCAQCANCLERKVK